jgi:hypothetical protein
MPPYTYAVGEFLTIESDVEIFLFDTPPQESVTGPDIRLRETDSEAYSVEWTGDGVCVALPRSLTVEKASSTEPVSFTKLLLSAVQAMLLRQGATLLFGAALQTPHGDGLGLFGPSDCGKSVASLRLARDRQYRLLADDLLVCHEGRVHPFPRYMNLPRDVSGVEQWVQSPAVPRAQVRLFPEEVDVPRRLVTESAPERVELDDIVLVGPPESGVERADRLNPQRVSTTRAGAVLATLQESALAGWTSHPAVRETVDSGGTDRHTVVREAITDATCYRLDATTGNLAAAVAALVER